MQRGAPSKKGTAMNSGLSNLDRMIQTSHLWLDDTAQRLGGDRQDAYHALRAVLAALRDRLPVDVAVNLSAQLPLLVRGIFFEGYRPGSVPVKLRSGEEFLEQVRSHLQVAPPVDPRRAVDAVLDVLTAQLDPGIFAKIAEMLPPELRDDLQLEARSGRQSATS
jgi:uncharacterized protein (DUF2267 family)